MSWCAVLFVSFRNSSAEFIYSKLTDSGLVLFASIVQFADSLAPLLLFAFVVGHIFFAFLVLPLGAALRAQLRASRGPGAAGHTGGGLLRRHLLPGTALPAAWPDGRGEPRANFKRRSTKPWSHFLIGAQNGTLVNGKKD